MRKILLFDKFIYLYALSFIIFMFDTSCNSKLNLSNHTECILLDSVENLYKCTMYDSLGNLERIGNYIDNHAVGTHKFYKEDKLDYIREYVLLEGMKSYLNQVYKIGEGGDTILSKSSFVRVNAPKNVLLNDSIIIEYEVVSSLFKSKELQAFFDIENNKDSVSFVVGNKNKIIYGIVCNKIGINKITCRIDEFDMSGAKPTQDSLFNTKCYFITYSFNVYGN